MLLTHPALPGPWSGNFCCTCCCAALALFLIRCRESSSIFSKWSSVVDDYRKICLISPGLLPSTTQKDHPSSSLWPALSCDDSFPIPSYPVPSRPVLSSPACMTLVLLMLFTCLYPTTGRGEENGRSPGNESGKPHAQESQTHWLSWGSLFSPMPSIIRCFHSLSIHQQVVFIEFLSFHSHVKLFV